MIIKGGPRCDWQFYATHLTRTDTNERMSIEEIRGLAAEDVRGALRELDAIASGSRAKNGLYVASLNPCEDERLTGEQWGFAVDRLERELGLAHQPRIVIEHFKEGRTHRHAVWGRIDADTMKAIPADHNYAKHEEAARDIERELGLTPVESVLLKDREGERPERRAKDWESFRAADTGIDPDAMKAEITALWQSSDSGLAFKAALEGAGYILAKGDRRDFVVVDQAADEHSLARRITGARAAEIRARMADVDRDSLPSVAEARRLALEAQGGESGAFSRQEPQAAATPIAAPASEDLRAAIAEEEARQLGPVPEWTPEVERELAARFAGWQSEAGDRKAGWEPETEDRKGKWHPETEPRSAEWQEEPAADAGQGERTTPWGRAWRAFSDRARAMGTMMRELWEDEASGTRGFATRLLDAGLDLWDGWRDGDSHTVAHGLGRAAAVARDLTAKGEGGEKSWVERVRERASEIWRNERGSVPDYAPLWDDTTETGQGAGEWPDGAPEPEAPEPDGGDLDGPDLE